MSGALLSFVSDWLRNAEPGEAVVYHRGELGRDRVADPDLQQVADKVLELSTARCDLVSACGHVRGEMVGTGQFEVTSRLDHGERLHIARRLK